MPTKFRFSILATLFALTAVFLVAGQASQAPQTSPASGQSAMAAHASSPEAHLQMLSEKLNLTDDQETKLRPVLQEREQQLKAMHDDSSLSQDQNRAKLTAIHESLYEQINAVLTPEQQDKFKEMKHEGMEKHQQ